MIDYQILETSVMRATVALYGSRDKQTIILLPRVDSRLPEVGRLIVIGERAYTVYAVYAARERVALAPGN